MGKDPACDFLLLGGSTGLRKLICLGNKGKRMRRDKVSFDQSTVTVPLSMKAASTRALEFQTCTRRPRPGVCYRGSRHGKYSAARHVSESLFAGLWAKGTRLG